jgi:hypothetical protein
MRFPFTLWRASWLPWIKIATKHGNFATPCSQGVWLSSANLLRMAPAHGVVHEWMTFFRQKEIS